MTTSSIGWQRAGWRPRRRGALLRGPLRGERAEVGNTVPNCLDDEVAAAR